MLTNFHGPRKYYYPIDERIKLRRSIPKPHEDPGNFVNKEFYSEAIKAPSSCKTGDTARKQELSAFLSKRCKEK
jgi:hypothetical protein